MKFSKWDKVRLRMWYVLGIVRHYMIGWLLVRLADKAEQAATARRQENGLLCALVLGGAR
jgi:hypothetical protein